MNALLALAAAAAAALLSCGTALAAPTGALALDGYGYVTTPDGIGEASLALAMSAGAPGQSGLAISGGTLVYGDEKLGNLEIDGSFLREARFVQLTGTAGPPHASVDVMLLGRLIAEQDGESIYLITGTLSRGGHEGRALLSASLSQPAASSAAATAAAERAPETELKATISIMAGSQDGGTRDGYLSATSVAILPNEAIIIKNEDEVSHRLVSGEQHGWDYARDGAPRMCGPDGTPDAMPDADGEKAAEPRTGTAISGGQKYTFTIPEPRESPSRSISGAGDMAGCDFIRDGLFEAELAPGESAVVTASGPGTHRVLDVSKPWIELLIVSIAPNEPIGRDLKVVGGGLQ